MKEFTYIESILVVIDTGEFQIERHKNNEDGAWYGIGLSTYTATGWDYFSDNDEWIAGTFYKQLQSGTYKNKWDLHIPCKKKTAKALEALIKEAYRLGWFDYLIDKQ